ncbi:MAG TPA: hypothetical protein VLE74_00075 [Candidatus Saccharimonadales bacterium]|nr:hypothetical protein [Candidatus Saccharimonadales bacterium]
MKFDLKTLPAKLRPTLLLLKRYIVFMFMIIMLGILGFLVFRVNQYSRAEPSEDAVTEKLQTVQRPKIDQSVLDKIQQLQGQNIQVQTLFDRARSNPFSE